MDSSSPTDRRRESERAPNWVDRATKGESWTGLPGQAGLGRRQALASGADSADMMPMAAFITVTDAAGRVLFRRAATDAEVREAVRAAEQAEREGEEAMRRIADERSGMESTEADQA